MVTVIVGDGGHARDIASWHAARMTAHHTLVNRDDSPRVLIGINDPHVRARVADALRLRAASAAVHPRAYVGPGCVVQDGVVIGPLSSLLVDVWLGEHTHVGAGSHLTRCSIGSFTTIAPGVTVCGDVTIGNRCMIGAGATIRNLVHIGDDVTIGAGAAVVHDVPDGATVKGVPAR